MKILDLLGLTELVEQFKQNFAKLVHTHKLEDITDYMVDSALSATSTNPIQNKTVNQALVAFSNDIGNIEASIDNLNDNKANVSDIPTKVSELTNDSEYLTSTTVPVKSVNGKTGVVSLTASDVGADASGAASAVQSNLNILNDEFDDHVDNADIHFTADERTKLAGIATGANKYTHPNSGVTSGTYKSVTVNAAGHVTGGTNPTTLSGYGITDAEAKGTVNTHNTSTSAHNDIRLLVSDISTKLNNFLNVDDTTKDQLSEIIALIDANADGIESITSGKVNVSDIINNLTTNTSNKPLSAAQGVVLKGLIDALQGALDTDEANLATHTGNTTIHITAEERADWNDAVSKEHTHSNKTVLDNTTASYTTAEKTKLSGIATGAEVNQNAFSNVKVGTTTVAAVSKTDTIEFAGSNVTITPDATNDKITFSVADGSTSAKGVVVLEDSVISTSTTTAATPNSVRLADEHAQDALNQANNAFNLAQQVNSTADNALGEAGAAKSIANTAITNAAKAQSTADSKIGSVSLASGTNNGTVKLTVDGKATDNIAVKGLGSAAYKSADTFSESGHTHNYAGSSSAGGAATSAVKLTTARNINGVEFDGTANIDITANPTTNTLTSSNLDDVKTVGFYNAGGGNSCTNKPANIDAFGMIVFKNAEGYICQLLVSGTGTRNIIYVRTYLGASWSGWNKQYSESNKPTPAEIGAATSEHTHNYAGSSSAGGAATSANKLNTNAGSATQPVFFENGVPKATTHTLGKSVPSDAKFTDTTYGAAGSSLGLVKTGGDVTIADGVITVNDDSHAHIISNIDGLQSALDGKLSTSGTAAEAITLSGLTATVTELNYVDGVTSNIQTQFNAVTDRLADLEAVADALAQI